MPEDGAGAAEVAGGGGGAAEVAGAGAADVAGGGGGAADVAGGGGGAAEVAGGEAAVVGATEVDTPPTGVFQRTPLPGSETGFHE